MSEVEQEGRIEAVCVHVRTHNKVDWVHVSHDISYMEGGEYIHTYIHMVC